MIISLTCETLTSFRLRGQSLLLFLETMTDSERDGIKEICDARGIIDQGEAVVGSLEAHRSFRSLVRNLDERDSPLA